MDASPPDDRNGHQDGCTGHPRQGPLNVKAFGGPTPATGPSFPLSSRLTTRGENTPDTGGDSTFPIHPPTHPRIDDAGARKADPVGMTLTDYVLDIGLIAVVFLQIRGRQLTLRTLLLPIAICGWAMANYLHGIPTAGNDLALVALATSLGITLGGLSGYFTRVTADPDGVPSAKAGVAAAILWVAGVGTRFALQLYATHGGAGAIGRFSAAHSITSGEAWGAALILMALGEAIARTAVTAYRGYRVSPANFVRRPTMITSGG